MMLIDLSVPVTPEMVLHAQGSDMKELNGHLGTHFDAMDKPFPLAYVRRDAVVFDVTSVGQDEVQPLEVDLQYVKPGMFVAFHSGWLKKTGYGSKAYASGHPQLSVALIESLLERSVAIIGVDFSGVRRGAEHTPMDQRCADQGAFVVENLCNLELVLDGARQACFIANTYPIHYLGLTGLPSRVVAEV